MTTENPNQAGRTQLSVTIVDGGKSSAEPQWVGVPVFSGAAESVLEQAEEYARREGKVRVRDRAAQDSGSTPEGNLEAFFPARGWSDVAAVPEEIIGCTVLFLGSRPDTAELVMDYRTPQGEVWRLVLGMNERGMWIQQKSQTDLVTVRVFAGDTCVTQSTITIREDEEIVEQNDADAERDYQDSKE